MTLRPGDLLVVEQAHYPFDNFADPFTSEGPDLVDHRSEPAIVIPSRPPNLQPRDDYEDASDDPFASSGGASHEGGGSSDPPSIFQIASLDDPQGPGMEELLESLTKSQDPLPVYRKLRPNERYPDSFYLQMGDLFLAMKKPKLASRVLSNLIETPVARPTAYRKWAFLLAKHQDWEGALDLLGCAAQLAPEDHAIVLDQAWVLEQQGNKQAALAKRKSILKDFSKTDRPSTTIAEIATAEVCKHDTTKGLPVDLRVLVTCASGQSLNLTMTEPCDTMTSFKRWSEPSKIGARAIETVGVAEYSLRQAVPGEYHLNYQNRSPQIVRLQIYRNWGREI